MTLPERIRDAYSISSTDPVFRWGMLLRIALIVAVTPIAHSEWFAPFLQHALENPLNAWGAHLAQGGDVRAFPYGIFMLLPLLPGALIGALAQLMTGWPIWGYLGISATVLIVDTLVLFMLVSMNVARSHRIIILYWLSPIVLYVCYWHGQLDIIPVFFLVLSMLFLKERRSGWSGALVAAAASAKLSMLIAPPIMLLYLASARRRFVQIPAYLVSFSIVFLISELPIILSSSARTMVLGTPEIDKVYDFALTVTSGVKIYIVPIAYLLVLFSAWLVRRISFDLLIALTGVSFLVIVLLTPASPGWYLWTVPFLVVTLAPSRRRTAMLIAAYSIVFVIFHLINSSGAGVLGIEPAFGRWLQGLQSDNRLMSLWLSLLFVLGLMLCVLLLRDGVLRNDFFRLSRRPVLLGIAGDSGSGKDTLAEALIGLVGPESATHVSGDDYHSWDRHKPMWQVMTHLNPRANDLDSFRRDILQLSLGRSIMNRHYDHERGKMTRPRLVPARDVLVVASGLHALYDPELVRLYDVCVFLEMDETLRRHLKLQRDVTVRGHTPDRVLSSIERRLPDRRRFIDPQARNADIFFQIRPVRHVDLSNYASRLPRLELYVRLSHGTPYKPLIRNLVGVCGIDANVTENDAPGPVEIVLEGTIPVDLVRLAAKSLDDHMFEILGYEPVWQPDTTGLMQLFIANQIASALRKRL